MLTCNYNRTFCLEDIIFSNLQLFFYFIQSISVFLNMRLEFFFIDKYLHCQIKLVKIPLKINVPVCGSVITATPYTTSTSTPTIKCVILFNRCLCEGHKKGTLIIKLMASEIFFYWFLFSERFTHSLYFI